MTDYVLFLLETDAAKRRLAQLFESETQGWADHLLTTIAARDRSRAAPTNADQNNNSLPAYRCTPGRFRDRTRTAIPTRESGQTKRGLTASGFVLALVLVGVIVAAHTDRPAFWLLVGPAPFAVLYILRTFFAAASETVGKDCLCSANGIDDITLHRRTFHRTVRTKDTAVA